MKSFLPIALLLAASTPAVRAASVIETYGSGTLNTAIPDNQPVLTSFLQSISTSSIQSLTEVSLTLELTGSPTGEGWASDMFASLIKSPVGVTPSAADPSSVLLDQVGVTVGDPVGFGYDGWNITFKDSASIDIHGRSLGSGVLTGTFRPDGRLAATDAAGSAFLVAFDGGAGNGDWRLNIGDLAENGTMRLVSWSLELTGENGVSGVPEASTWAAGAGMLVVVGASWWRARRRA